MGLEYFTCADCGDTTDDSGPEFEYWHCCGCDFTLCDACARGTWKTCPCSARQYCETCVAAGGGCEDCGKLLDCERCDDPENCCMSEHNPGCALRTFKGLFTAPPDSFVPPPKAGPYPPGK